MRFSSQEHDQGCVKDLRDLLSTSIYAKNAGQDKQADIFLIYTCTIQNVIGSRQAEGS